MHLWSAFLGLALAATGAASDCWAWGATGRSRPLNSRRREVSESLADLPRQLLAGNDQLVDAVAHVLLIGNLVGDALDNQHVEAQKMPSSSRIAC